MQAAMLEGGFANPPHESARAFRAVMNAMARPGQVFEIEGAEPPAPLSRAAGTLLLTLCDGDTGIYLAPGYDVEAVRTWIGFHIGAPLVAAEQAAFAVGSWEDLAPLNRFSIGTSEYPDRSTTFVVDGVPASASSVTLRGPGIKTEQDFSLPEPEVFQNNHALFPLGWDFIFTQGDQISALPRSTEVN